MKQKPCTKCKRVFPIARFWKNGRGKINSYCPDCAVARHRDYVNANRETRRAGQRKHYARNAHKVYRANMVRKYQITHEQLDYLLNSAQCDICGEIAITNKLVIDHSHETGENRGILCTACNAGLGCFRDDPALLKHAISYLENNGSGFFKGK